jgi:spermidine/putrescine transport system ATP-binding protein
VAGGRIELKALTKRFTETAVDAIDLDIASGEFFSLLGPSGCGKTTTLRMIAGFEQPTSGEILLDGTDVSRVSPDKRNVNTVFQSYALFPFLTVYDNVAFGLRYRKTDKTEKKQRVNTALELVEMGSYAKRRPSELSGGQQQRVALARALVLNPAVLLLDEPLGALDAKLRRSLKVELKALQERVGITFLYVTHDQEEALTMSDRLAVMHEGRLAQVGTPRDVYDEPATTYVADFLGVSNLMPVEVLASGPSPRCQVKLGDSVLYVDTALSAPTGPGKLCIRPEKVTIDAHGAPGDNRAPGMIERSVFLGSHTQVYVRLAAGPSVQAQLNGESPVLDLTQGTPVSVHLPPQALRVLPDAT